MSSSTQLQERLNYVQGCIQKAALKSGRNPKQVTLIAVTKSFPLETWEQAIKVNLKTIGESRIQETKEKVDTFNKRDKIELHLLGHLQSNKVRKAVELFDVIQTVDSIKLANRINSVCEETLKKQRIFLQVNTGADPKKHGISAENATFVARKISKMKNLKLAGIMTIPAHNITQKELRLVYRKTRKIRDEICIKINDQCKNISMGMSRDYEVAIAEGATHIRIGVGLFGCRPQ